MTTLLTRPASAVEAPRLPPPRPVSALAAAGAVIAAGVGLVGCLAVAVVGWLAGSSGNAQDALRTGGDAWLLAHGSALHVGGATLGVLPLGLTALIGLLLSRVGAWCARSTEVNRPGAALKVATVLTVCYAATAVLVASVASTHAVPADSVRAGLGAALLAAVCGGLGVVRAAGFPQQVGMPASLRAMAAGMAAGVAAMFVVGWILVTAGLVADLAGGESMVASLHTGLVGGLVLALTGALLLPNAALWAAAYAVGPGFTVGAGTLVTPTDVRLGPVPAYPLFAALPGDGRQWPWLAALLGVPILVGGLAGTVAVRRHRPGSLVRTAGLAGFTGVFSGLALGLLVALAGAAGPGRLADAGPRALDCALVGALGMGLGGALAGLAMTWLSRRGAGRRSEAPSG